MKKYLLLFLIFPSLIFSENPRLYQFVSREANESFFILEIGTLHQLLNKQYRVESMEIFQDIFSEGGVTLSLQSKGVELSGGYYFPENKVTLSSDLYLGSYTIGDNLLMDIGVGGGIHFTSSLDSGLSSDILLRTPIRIKRNNFFFKFNSMAGSSMFKKDPRIRWNLSFDIGYMFDLVRDKPMPVSNRSKDEDPYEARISAPEEEVKEIKKPIEEDEKKEP